MNAAIANWFNRKRSRALTLVYVGFGVSGLLVPLVSINIGRVGWRETLIAVAVTSWLLGLPLSTLMRHRPGQYGYLPDGEAVPAKESAEPTHPHSPNETIKHGSGHSARDLTAMQA
jgi:sugar phosphate permease